MVRQGDFSLGVLVDSSMLDAMLNRAMYSMSGVSLGQFMHGFVDPYVRTRASERFASEGDAAVGGQWRPLRESTIEIRESLGFPGEHPINRRTGELEDFITERRGAVHNAPTSAVLEHPAAQPTGELGKKLRTAQQGDRKSGAWPRPVLGLDTMDLQVVMEGLDQHIFNIMAGP